MCWRWKGGDGTVPADSHGRLNGRWKTINSRRPCMSSRQEYDSSDEYKKFDNLPDDNSFSPSRSPQ